MTTTITVLTMADLPIVPRATLDWNLAVLSGEWRGSSVAANSPLSGEIFIGMVEVLAPFIIMQTLRTQTTMVREFRRVSHDEAGVITWGTWVELLVGGGSGGIGTAWPMFLQVEGTIPTLVGSIRLPSGTYTPSAQIGSGDNHHATTLLIKVGTTILATLGGVTGGITWQTAPPFTLAATSEVDLYLYGNVDYDNAYFKGLELL
jgi:hypothetical protein